MRTDTIYFVTAIRNEELIVEKFLAEIQCVSETLNSNIEMLIVDDWSSDKTPEILTQYQEALKLQPLGGRLKLNIIKLRQNRGNQGALGIGIKYLADLHRENNLNGSVVTFDSDGEDDLTKIPDLCRYHQSCRSKILFIQRVGSRQSGIAGLLYPGYRIAFKLLTGCRIVPCNFMVIPVAYLEVLSQSPFLMFHVAGACHRLRYPYEPFFLRSRPRFGGRSSQSLENLVSHALTSLLVFYETIISRLLILLLSVSGIVGMLTIFILIAKLISPELLPLGLTSTMLTLFLLSFSLFVIFLVILSTMLGILKFLTSNRL